MQIELNILFSVAIALIGVYATFSKINRDSKKDREDREAYRMESVRKQTERHTELSVKLDSVSRATDNMLNEIRSIDQKVDTLDKRLALNEASTKSAHKRVDELKALQEKKRCVN